MKGGNKGEREGKKKEWKGPCTCIGVYKKRKEQLQCIEDGYSYI